MKAVDFLWRHATHVMSDEISADTVNVEHEAFCGVCQRNSSEWVDSRGVPFSQYGVTEMHCLPCHTLFHGSLKFMGLERTASGGTVKVPGKLGMLASCALLVSEHRNVILTGESYFEKLSQAETPMFELVRATGMLQIKWLLENMPKPPFLFISNLGRKKHDLVANLRLTTSSSCVYLCSADGVEALDVPRFREVFGAITELDLPVKVVDEWCLLVRKVARGEWAPNDKKVTEFFEGNPQLVSITQKLPADPYAKISITHLIQKFRSEA